MKHFAIRSKSIRAGDRPFTCPGLGDRIHSVWLAHLYRGKSDVTIHVTDDKWSIAGGVLSDKKPKSWREIIDLFPKGIYIQNHEVENLGEDQWLRYLKDKGFDADTYYYSDSLHIHPNDYKIGIDASSLLSKPTVIPPTKKVPEMSKYFTFNFDSTDTSRSISPLLQPELINKQTFTGLRPIKITGDMSLQDAGALIANGQFHVGVDSGIMHLARLYKEYKDIILYTRTNGYRSHHLLRAVRNGSKEYVI